MPHYKAPDNSLHFLDSAEYEYLLPAGSVAITDDEAKAINELNVAANAPSIESLKTISIEKVKELRRMVFTTLAGLQSEASTKGDTATAVGILPVQEALRSLPNIDLSACQTQADIDAAFLNAWNAIVAITPDSVKTAFNGVL